MWLSSIGVTLPSLKVIVVDRYSPVICKPNLPASARDGGRFMIIISCMRCEKVISLSSWPNAFETSS